MKKLKLLASAVALVAAASQANATQYTLGGSFIVNIAVWNLPFTINSGNYDDVTGNGTWNVFADLTSIPGAGTLLFDQNFTMNAATGTGVLGAAYNCVGPSCLAMAPQFQGPWTGTPVPITTGLNTWALPTAFGLANFKPVLTPVAAPIPVPAAAWLFGSAVLGLAGIGRHRKMI